MKILLLIALLFGIFPSVALARVTPNEIYESKRETFESQVSKLSSENQAKVHKVDQLLISTNQKVSSRFDIDIAKLAAILVEVRSRRGIEHEPTVIAFGQGETLLESAEYWVNYAQEAVAYQKIQDYTPSITTENALNNSLTASKNRLNSDLKNLQSKILRAKNAVKKVLDEDV